MGERHARIVYGPRDTDGNRDRYRMLNTFDPYDYHLDGQPLRRAKSAKGNDRTPSMESIRASQVPRYVDDIQRCRRIASDEELGLPPPPTRPRPESQMSITTADADRGKTFRDLGSRDLDYSLPPIRNQDRHGTNYGRDSRGPREYSIDSNRNKDRDVFRREGNLRVMDTYGEVEVIVPGRDHKGPRGGHTLDYDHGRSDRTTKKYYTGGTYGQFQVLPSNTISRRTQSPPTGHKTSQYFDTRSTDTQSGQREYDQDDEWRIVDSMRDTRLDSDWRRSRTTTQSSDDSFIMVNPGQDTRSTVRSAIRRTDYPPAELRRRRSRSISFRDSETISHDAGDRRHERPGAEADISGPYLRRKAESETNSDAGDYDYQRGPSDTRRSRRPGSGYYAPHDRYREPYPPQMDYVPRSRDRSRRRRRDEEEDDTASYYSEHIDKRYLKDSRYS